MIKVNKFEAKTEKPHCGISPNTDPAKGPNLLIFLSFFTLFNLCSNISITIKETNKKGNNFKVSIQE